MTLRLKYSWLMGKFGAGKGLKPLVLEKIALFVYMSQYPFMWLFVLLVLVACDSAIPSPPAVTVIITAVDDTQALQQGVAEALTGTAQVQAGLTETVFAQGGITLTPSTTPTSTAMPSITPTRFVTATRTPTATSSPTSTFSPVSTHAPAIPVTQGAGWVRVLNSRVQASGQPEALALDVFVNDERIVRQLEPGQQTNYYQVAPGAVRISLGKVDEPPTTPNGAPPLLTTVINVQAGQVISVVATGTGNGLTLYPVPEDPAPLAAGQARLTVVQFNPVLGAVNALLPDKRLELAKNLGLGSIVGPLDVPAGSYAIHFHDAAAPDQLIAALPPLQLRGQLSYLLILLPPASIEEGLIRIQLVNSLTGRLASDVGVRFVNALPNRDSITLKLGQSDLYDLALGSVSNTIPVSGLGTPFSILAEGAGGEVNLLNNATLGPWSADANKDADKIILLYPNPQVAAPLPVSMGEFDQNPPRSTINASIRLIHALSGTVPLNLQIRAIRQIVDENGVGRGQEETPWVPLGQAITFATASDYFSRTPEVYEVRVLQSGSQTLIASLPAQEFLAGGVYDFVVLPGQEMGSAQLLLLQPGVQVTQLVMGIGNPTAVYEAVAATLTAAAPISTATPTRAASPTPTRTPVSTNTPRPSNTPDYLLPILLVNPAPPETAVDNINLRGENFQPGQPYVITLDDRVAVIISGRINDDGTLLATIPLDNLSPGLHSLRVCVDCRVRGAQQAQYALFIVADPSVTATATAQP